MAKNNSYQISLCIWSTITFIKKFFFILLNIFFTESLSTKNITFSSLSWKLRPLTTKCGSCHYHFRVNPCQKCSSGEVQPLSTPQFHPHTPLNWVLATLMGNQRLWPLCTSSALLWVNSAHPIWNVSPHLDPAISSVVLTGWDRATWSATTG